MLSSIIKKISVTGQKRCVVAVFAYILGGWGKKDLRTPGEGGRALLK